MIGIVYEGNHPFILEGTEMPQFACASCGKRLDSKQAYVEFRDVEPGLVRATSIAGRAGLRKQGVLQFCNRQELADWLRRA